MEVNGYLHAAIALQPRKELCDAYWIVGWTDLRIGPARCVHNSLIVFRIIISKMLSSDKKKQTYRIHVKYPPLVRRLSEIN
jgi:hypothetical protein